MRSNRDPLGYYAALNVDPSAPIDKIKKAFKAKAQELHPDRNASADATRRFQFLNEAYQVLGNPHSRSEYDASAYALDQRAENVAERSRTPVQPIACWVCGKISVQPRYAIYRYVASFFLLTYRSGHQGVFCAKCAERRAYKNSLITWIFGWWGLPWGPIYSIQAIVHNMLGGEQPPLSNFRILAVQAVHFASNGSMDLARLIADQALEFAGKIPGFGQNRESAADRDLRAAVAAIQNGTPAPTRTLKSSWGTRSLSFRVQAFVAGVAGIALLTLLIPLTGASRPAYRHAAPSRDVFDDARPNGRQSSASGDLNPGEFMAQQSAAAEAPAMQTPAPPKGQDTHDWDVVGVQPQNPAQPARSIGLDALFKSPTQPLPRTGRMHIIRRRAHDQMAPLTIESFPGSPNYYIKLVDWSSHEPVMLLFIRSGEVLSGKVPLGAYEIHYAAGNAWYGEEYVFGPETSYTKADTQLVFEREGDKLAGYTIQLRKQPEGNLKEIPISPSEF